MRGQCDWIYHLWQWVQHARLHFDLLQALNGEHLTVPGFQQWEPEFLSQYHVCIGEEWSQINLKMSIGVWSTLPIFLPIYLHSSLSLQCHAQRTYLFTLIWLNSMSIFIIILKTNKQKQHVHSYTCLCKYIWFSVSVNFYNWHSSNTQAYPFNYFSSQQIGNTNFIYIYMCVCVCVKCH